MKWTESLWGDHSGLAEIRGLNRFTGKPLQKFFVWPSEELLIDEFLDGLKEDYNLFAGVLLRHYQDGSSAACDPYTSWLWADLDEKTGIDFDAVLDSPYMPAMIVASGNGWHVYWHLQRPIPIDEARKAMRAIANALGGDYVDDPARILRIPGTINWKDEKNPKPVRLMYYHPNIRVRPEDLILEYEARQSREYTGPTGTKGSRSEVLFKETLDLLRSGVDDPQEIYQSLLEMPEGSKLREMRSDSRREKWVTLTIKNARKALSKSR